LKHRRSLVLIRSVSSIVRLLGGDRCCRLPESISTCISDPD
jgi:hypothetical protein